MRTNEKIELVDVMPAGPFTVIYNHKVPPFNNPRR